MLENEPASSRAEPRPPPAGQQSVEVLVGIPAYNEEIGIGSTVVSAKEHADLVVVVDDGSTDRTAETAEAAGATVLRHGTNRGKGAAIKTLLAYAREVDCRALVLIDGDGQHLPTDIPDVAAPVLEGDADLVIGNRHHATADGSGIPRYRRFGQYALDGLTRLTTGAPVTDTQTGFRALSPAAIEAITPDTARMGVESEMLHAAVRQDLRIDEVPIDVRYDGIDGQTHNPVSHGLQVGIRLLTLPPGRVLGIGALAGLAAGTAGVRWIGSRARADGSERSRGPARHVASAAVCLLGAALGSIAAAALALVARRWDR